MTLKDCVLQPMGLASWPGLISGVESILSIESIRSHFAGFYFGHLRSEFLSLISPPILLPALARCFMETN